MERAGIIIGGALAWHANSLDAISSRVLLPIANRPLIDHILERLAAAGVRRAALCVTEFDASVIEHLRAVDSSQLEIHVLVDRSPRGSAGCARDAAELLAADHYFVVEGSVVPRVDLNALIADHLERRAAASIVVTSGGAAAGEYAREPVGIHVVSREALMRTPAIGYQDLKETVLPRMRQAGSRVVVYETAELCPRVHDLDSYLLAQDVVLADLRHAGVGAATGNGNGRLAYGERRWPAGVVTSGEVLVSENATVADGVTLIGPCVIGHGSVIHENAIVAGSVVWNNCQIGRSAVLRECVAVSNTCIAADVKRDREILMGRVAT